MSAPSWLVPEAPDRWRAMVRALSLASVAALVLGVVALVLPGRAGDAVAAACLVLVGSAPVVRVGWLAVRWLRFGDRRYAALAVLLLAVVASGPLLSVLR